MTHRVEITEKTKALFEQNNALIHWYGRYDVWQGSVQFEDDIAIESYSLRPYNNGNLISVGSFSYYQSTLPLNTKIGRYSSIAPNVTAMGSQHPTERFTTAPLTYPSSIPFGKEHIIHQNIKLNRVEYAGYNEQPPAIIIENDVWIGKDVVLKAGITIGTGSVIAQGAIVTKDVPPYSIIGGVPAKVIRKRFDEETIERLLQSKWWEYAYWDFEGIQGDDNIIVFLEKFEALVQGDVIQKFQPHLITANDILATQM